MSSSPWSWTLVENKKSKEYRIYKKQCLLKQKMLQEVQNKSIKTLIENKKNKEYKKYKKQCLLKQKMLQEVRNIMKECNDCDFVVYSNDDLDIMISHCCCQWEQQYCGGRFHRTESYYCSLKCYDCGWGGCGCFYAHCCCPELEPNCDGHQFNFVYSRHGRNNLKK